jgi:hypothetical protein
VLDANVPTDTGEGDEQAEKDGEGNQDNAGALPEGAFARLGFLFRTFPLLPICLREEHRDRLIQRRVVLGLADLAPLERLGLLYVLATAGAEGELLRYLIPTFRTTH